MIAVLHGLTECTWLWALGLTCSKMQADPLKGVPYIHPSFVPYIPQLVLCRHTRLTYLAWISNNVMNSFLIDHDIKLICWLN